MIKAEPTPYKTVQYFKVEIELDQTYTCDVLKKINGITEYKVDCITPYPISQDNYDLIEKTAINYANKEGLGKNTNLQ